MVTYLLFNIILIVINKLMILRFLTEKMEKFIL